MRTVVSLTSFLSPLILATGELFYTFPDKPVPDPRHPSPRTKDVELRSNLDSLHFADACWSGPALWISVCEAAATEGSWRNPRRSGVGSGAHRPVAVGFEADGSDKTSIQRLEFCLLAWSFALDVPLRRRGPATVHARRTQRGRVADDCRDRHSVRARAGVGPVVDQPRACRPKW